MPSIRAAFTSVLGAYKFDGYQQLSFHECAALAIARRALNYSERPKWLLCHLGFLLDNRDLLSPDLLQNRLAEWQVAT